MTSRPDVGDVMCSKHDVLFDKPLISTVLRVSLSYLQKGRSKNCGFHWLNGVAKTVDTNGAFVFGFSVSTALDTWNSIVILGN